MAAGAVKPAVSYAAVAARGTDHSSSSGEAESPTAPQERPKGKTRDSKVSFAEHEAPNERTSLLRQQDAENGQQREYDAGEEDNGEEDSEREDEGLVARARRAIGLGRSNGYDRLPLYAEDGRTQRPVPLRGALGAVLGLILVVVLVAGALLVRSGDHNTGPSPRPPTGPTSAYPAPTGGPAYPVPTGGTSGPRNPAYLINAENGAVASEAQVCSQIGVDVLKDGGNAIDAAIASNLCVGTVNPFSAGIGGAVFAPEGRILEKGDWVKRENFSYTLTRIAAEGPDVFYTGEIATSIIDKIQQTGGIMTREDLASYQVVQRPALEGTYRGRRVYTTHAPSSGPVLLHVLNALDRFGAGPNIHDKAAMKDESGLWWHRVTEALKFGSAARTRLGDPAFGINKTLVDEIPTRKFGDKVSSRITDDKTHTPEYYNPIYDVQIDHGTTHTSAADSDGTAIALTSSVNLIWGSRVMDGATGIILNDVMDDFSMPGVPNAFGLWPSPWNYPEAGKRQVSSMAPAILEHPSGEFYLALGGSGGSRIFGAIAQTILNMDRGMDVSQAVEAPRVHDQLFPSIVTIESEFEERPLQALKQRGHNVTVFDINLGVAEIQAVSLDKDGHISAASDSRKNGVAAGW
ncbi:hypothetical protein FRC07_004427 [Ceratobasidium sp. 392]|nr:hypothetical protein FRC07_004427 [Ceratobasidium sp. 392]